MNRVNLGLDILSAVEEPGARVFYATATDVNTVPVDGVDTAREYAALSPVVAGDYCMVVRPRSGDICILGARNPVGPIGTMIEFDGTISVVNGGSGQIISWGTGEEYLYERGTFKALADNAFTIPTGLGGIYQVGLTGEFATNATGIRQLWISVASNSGTGDENNLTVTQSAHSTLRTRMQTTGALYLDEGAVLTPRAYQNSGGALDITDLRFQLLRLG